MLIISNELFNVNRTKSFFNNVFDILTQMEQFAMIKLENGGESYVIWR